MCIDSNHRKMQIEWEQKKEGKKEQSTQALRKMELGHERVEKEKEWAYNAEQKEKECCGAPYITINKN